MASYHPVLSGTPAHKNMNLKASSSMAHDQEKETVARASLEFVRDGNVVGLGSGSTAVHVVRLLGERARANSMISLSQRS